MGAQAKLTSRLAALDGLRAIAVSGVIITHVNPERLPGGQLGVDLFFTLSGYLITGILLSEHRRFGSISLKSFYIRRFLRLAPALLVFAAAATAVSLYQSDRTAWAQLLAALTYTMNFVVALGAFSEGSYVGHTWSLAVEEQFYLVWPLALTVILMRRPNWLLPITTGAVAAGLLITLAFQRGGMDIRTIYFLPTTRIAPLLVGALGAMVHHYGAPAWRVRVTSQPLLALGALLAMGAWMFHNTWSDPWTWRAGLAVFAALTVLVILHVSETPDSPVTKALSSRPVVWIGQRSYGIYLWHPVGLWVLAARFPSQWMQLGVTVAASFALAELSWRFVEKPALRYKERFARVTSIEPPPPVKLRGSSSRD